MRLYFPLARRPQLYPTEDFPFQERLPLKLKPTVSGKGDKTAGVACVQEMTILFTCLKKNEFVQSPCSNEIQAFNTCYKNFSDAKRQRKEQERRGELNPGARRLTHKQLNQLLKRFPT